MFFPLSRSSYTLIITSLTYIFEFYFSHPMSFLARPIFFQNYPRYNPDYIIRTRPDYIIRITPVHRTETDLHVIVVFIIVFQ